MLAVAAVMMLAACTGSKTTHLSGEFGDNAPDRVKVSVGEDFDTTVKVEDDKFEVDVPKNLASLSRVRAGMSVYSFVSDGSKITLNPADGKAYSDKKKGVWGQFLHYRKRNLELFSFCPTEVIWGEMMFWQRHHQKHSRKNKS